MESNDRIVELIKLKGKANDQAFTHCRNFFNLLRAQLRKTEQQLRSIITPAEPSITIEFEDKGRLEVRFRFANDVLLFYMHTTVVTFDVKHPLMKTSYIKDNPLRALSGMHTKTGNFIQRFAFYSGKRRSRQSNHTAVNNSCAGS